MRKSHVETCDPQENCDPLLKLELCSTITIETHGTMKEEDNWSMIILKDSYKVFISKITFGGSIEVQLEEFLQKRMPRHLSWGEVGSTRSKGIKIFWMKVPWFKNKYFFTDITIILCSPMLSIHQFKNVIPNNIPWNSMGKVDTLKYPLIYLFYMAHRRSPGRKV